MCQELSFTDKTKKNPFTQVCDYLAAVELEIKQLCEYQKQRERKKPARSFRENTKKINLNSNQQQAYSYI